MKTINRSITSHSYCLVCLIKSLEIYSPTEFQGYNKSWDLPGSPVVKTMYLQYMGHRSDPGQGTKIPHAKTKITCGKKKKKYSSVMSDSATSRTVAHQAPLSMEFSRQESWSGIFSSGSSQPKDRTQVSCVAGRFFTI